MATRAATPPVLQGPSAKEKKYDRQLRLWAANGQRALEEAHVLLLNTSPGVVGVEILKNLILPGIGNFTIVDDELVTEADLGVNFFLAEDSLGRSRAEESYKYLQELNPEVHGHAVQESIASFIDQKDILDQYTLILLVGPARPLGTLDKICQCAWKRSIPLFYIHSIGFHSHFSVQLPVQFPIVDTHPDPASTQDLRLLNPWPELSTYARSKTENLDALENHEHGHVPYLLLLLHYLEIFKASHGGQPPADYSQKKEFKTMVQQGQRVNNAEGPEENYDEALASVLKSLNPPSLSTGLREVFEADECRKLRSDTENFWVVAHAIYSFYSRHQALPLPGALPDMKAQSADYIELQNIYKAKARQDVTEVTNEVRRVEQNLRRKSAVDDKEIEAFCKGAAFIKLIKGRPIRVPLRLSEMDWTDEAPYIRQELENEDSLLLIYICFLAYDHAAQDVDFPRVQRGDVSASDVNAFVSRCTDYASAILGHIQTFSTGKDNSDAHVDTSPYESQLRSIVAELSRARGAELHSISALTGGMVAQEAIKVITKQYIPVNNTCVFDGIASKSGVFCI